jgi:hypothetical protein
VFPSVKQTEVKQKSERYEKAIIPSRRLNGLGSRPDVCHIVCENKSFTAVG